MDLTSNYFELFGLPAAYNTDNQLLTERYRDLQKQFHPDRYASQPAAQQKLAVQYTALINHAYATLRSPVGRAQYLLEQQGVDSRHDSTTIRDPEFLLAQMALREALADVADATDPFTELEKLEKSVDKTYAGLQRQFAREYEGEALDDAVATVAKMQFYQKLRSEIEQREEELDT